MLELVIVVMILGIIVMILGIIVSIAVPRMSRGSQGAAESALTKTLSTLRNALELYRAERNGQLPPKDDVQVALCGYSDPTGTNFVTAKDQTHYLGPYLASPPPLPVGERKGACGIAKNGDETIGWIYDRDAGTIVANTEDSEVDASGKRYNQY